MEGREVVVDVANLSVELTDAPRPFLWYNHWGPYYVK